MSIIFFEVFPSISKLSGCLQANCLPYSTRNGSFILLRWNIDAFSLATIIIHLLVLIISFQMIIPKSPNLNLIDY